VIITNGSTGQISAVTFFAKKRKKAAIKNLLGEPGVSANQRIKTKNPDRQVKLAQNIP